MVGLTGEFSEVWQGKELEEVQEIKEAERKGRVEPFPAGPESPIAQSALGKRDLRGRRDPSQKTLRVKWNC